MAIHRSLTVKELIGPSNKEILLTQRNFAGMCVLELTILNGAPMLKVSTISRDKAGVTAYGHCWYVDDGNHTIRENLGFNRPAFADGAFFQTLEEAQSQPRYASYSVVRLAETLKVPSQSPIIKRKGEHALSNTPLTRITILTFDLGGRGLCVEDHTIAAVDFSMPTPDLIDLVDVVPSHIYIRTEPLLRVSLKYGRDGSLTIVDNPSALINDVFKPCKNTMAFFQHADAVAEADKIRDMLLHAADYKSREIDFLAPVTVASGEAAEIAA